MVNHEGRKKVYWWIWYNVKMLWSQFTTTLLCMGGEICSRLSDDCCIMCVHQIIMQLPTGLLTAVPSQWTLLYVWHKFPFGLIPGRTAFNLKSVLDCNGLRAKFYWGGGWVVFLTKGLTIPALYAQLGSPAARMSCNAVNVNYCTEVGTFWNWHTNVKNQPHPHKTT